MSSKQELQAWIEGLSEEEARWTLEQLQGTRQTGTPFPQDDFERRLARLAQLVNPSISPLPDKAVCRETIYDLSQMRTPL